jgi:glutamyl-tRNA reductase
MSNLVLVGLNHRTAGVGIRERAAIQADRIPDALRELSLREGIRESMILSTCNRVELLSLADDDEQGIAALESFLRQYSQLTPQDLENSIYHYTGDQVVHHAFRVASSLDSMILGESQILGQVKSSYNLAVEAQTIGSYLNSLLQAAFRAAKRVRSETGIGEYSVSVGSALVELSRKILGNLKDKCILIIGAGKMGEMAIRHLVSSGAKTVQVANRSATAARDLAERFCALAVPYEDLRSAMTHSDVIITSTGAAEILIDHSMVQQAMHQRKNAPFVFIDISVPRNVDPNVSSIDNVFCYDIDDLGAVVEANALERSRESARAEKIVEQEAQAFCTKLRAKDMTPIVMQIQDSIEGICQSELQRHLRKIGTYSPRETQELESMVSRIAGKIAHPLLAQLRTLHQDPSRQDAYLEFIRHMFHPRKDPE